MYEDSDDYIIFDDNNVITGYMWVEGWGGVVHGSAGGARTRKGISDNTPG